MSQCTTSPSTTKLENYFCIPDIHGCKHLLIKALDQIYSRQGSGKIIFLGDYIDRGPDSYGVIEHLLKGPKEGWEFVLLKGNHEEMFLENGGTKNAYDIESNRIYFNEEMMEWLKALKLFHIEDANVFAHAWYDPDSNQSDQSILWIRARDSEPYSNKNFYLTHGHTPRKAGPTLAPNRTNLDCGAVFYGELVIAEYQPGVKGPINFIRVR